MRRTLSIIMLLVLLVTAVGCDGTRTDTEGEGITGEATLPLTPETEPPETEPPETEPPLDHRTLECLAVDEWKRVGITWSGVDETVVMDIPLNWTLKKYDGSTYIILRDGRDIGDIRLGDPSTALAVESSRTYLNGDGDVELCTQVRRVREGSGEGFRRLLGFFYADGAAEHTVYLEIDYTELDDAAVEHIGADFDKGSRDDVVTVSLAGGNASNKILVAGNSFVRTSSVGVFLTQFTENGGQPYEIEWISTSSVTIVYYLGAEWLARIRSGEFHAIAMCGLYYAANVADLHLLIDACRVSDTVLVMFPAYNESSKQIASAKAKYPGLTVLNWKDEINRFIDAGISKWDFCINDSYLHSKPLAGYVGAHMLYMTLFDEVPPEYEGDSPLSMTYIREKLGDTYVRTGVSPGESPIYKLVELTP